MNKEPISKETVREIYQNMGNNFLLYVPIICKDIFSIENIDKGNVTEGENKPEAVMLKLGETLLRLKVFALIANLDLSTLLRATLRTELIPEKRCNLKYIDVITLEAYKYLFGYGKDKKNGIWEGFKLLAEQISDDELKSDIIDFEQFVKEFENKYALSEDRNSRNFSIHYDQDPLKVYENLEKIKEEDEAKRTIAFSKVLLKLFHIVEKHTPKYSVSIAYSTSNYDLTLHETVNIFPDKENKLFNVMAGEISSFCNRLDNIVSKCQAVESIKEKFNFDDSFLQPLIKVMSPAMHIHFIYLDLASAMRAYLSSEYYFEKQMNLRRINIIVYEGFKHIYGYTDDDHNKSFWQKHIYSVLENSADQNLKDSLIQLELDLKAFATNTDINNERLRECSVHYRYKDRDNVIPLFHVLIESNPIAEMNKALMLIQKLLPPLIELNSAAMSAVNKTENDKVQAQKNEMIERLDSTLNVIKNGSTMVKQDGLVSIFNELKKD